MGKQSSRIYYKEKDHKEIFFRGCYHRALYKGSKLMWMKLDGEKYIPMAKSVKDEYGIYIYYPESKGIEKILELQSEQELIFNGTFLFTDELEFISRDGKKYESYDYEKSEKKDIAVISGCIGHKKSGGEYWFFFNDNGKIEKEIKLPVVQLKYENIKTADYFRDYYFFRRQSGHRNVLGIIRKDGYELPDVTFRGGTISYYVYANDLHIILVAYNSQLYVYKTKDLSTWTYYNTGIETIIGNNESMPEMVLSCINDGEKYLLYVQSRKGFRRQQTLLYETYDFEKFVNIPLPVYITLYGTKEESVRYLITDEEKFWNAPPDEDNIMVIDRSHFFQPAYVDNESTLIYNNGIRMNPQSIISSWMYIDNLYLQDSENNMVLDFWED